MKLIHRIGYYGLGLFFGIVILIFFLGGKRTSCDYSPNARVLKDIRIKKRNFSEESLAFLNKNELDTAISSRLLENGNVDFGKSDTEGDPCNVYYISGIEEMENLEMEIENCDSIATIRNFQFLKN